MSRVGPEWAVLLRPSELEDLWGVEPDISPVLLRLILLMLGLSSGGVGERPRPLGAAEELPGVAEPLVPLPGARGLEAGPLLELDIGALAACALG
jgi:hypothetical protein